MLRFGLLMLRCLFEICIPRVVVVGAVFAFGGLIRRIIGIGFHREVLKFGMMGIPYIYICMYVCL
jgi:hypothetical protein